MSYNIVLNPKYKGTDKLFNVLIDGEKLSNFNPLGIICMEIKKIPSFLNTVIAEKDFDIIDYSRISFGEYEFDGEILVPKGMVSFSVFDDRVLLPKNEFFDLCLQLAYKSLEGVDEYNLKQKNIIDEKWMEAVKIIIPQLEEKIKSYRN